LEGKPQIETDDKRSETHSRISVLISGYGFGTNDMNTLEIYSELGQIAERAATAQELMAQIVRKLHDKLPKYNWVGFYMLEMESEESTLVLGPFVGAPTQHSRIPVTQGICGAAAASGQTVIVDDVHSDSRYLACSLETKSEIVAPVFVQGKVAGELDIDSHDPAAFGPEDRALVEHCAALVGKYLERHQSPDLEGRAGRA
jgi:GAF domain-containing protein